MSWQDGPQPKDEPPECPECEGTGKTDGEKCLRCNGNGYLDPAAERWNCD